jgi:hypothetical protein
MVPLAPYFKNRGISDSLAWGGKRVNELVASGVAGGTIEWDCIARVLENKR